jgi:Ni/Fe-hydrogenase subunit HybB-like protein
MDNSSEIPDTSKAINDRLQFLWSQYMNMVNLFITLSTGSLALSTGLLKFQPQMAYSGKAWLMAALISLVLSLFASTSWRILTQIFMEQEVFGNTESVNAYYKKEYVIPFTSSHQYTPSHPFHNICTVGVIICMFCTAMGLPLGLMFISIFVFLNV